MEIKGIANESNLPPATPPGHVIWEAWDEKASRMRPQHGARLEHLVRERIVPRLVMLHRLPADPPDSPTPSSEDIVEFSQLVIGSDAESVAAFVQRMRDRGMTTDGLFESLFAPTARRLGELWEQDLCDFVEVGLGVARLQAMLGELAEAQMVSTDMRRRALLISTKCDSHVFGLDVVASFLRSSGWDTVVEKGVAIEESANLVAANWFSVVGVTMSCESRFDSVARVLAAVRRASRNPAISIMVGGVAFAGRPDLVARIGAEAAAHDGPSAALLAQRLHLRQIAATAARGKPTPTHRMARSAGAND